jgi:ElaB/YqjD/DUF883 family membrane-anchored ribosome-binding protein
MFEESTTEQLKKDLGRLMDDVASLRREFRQTGASSLEAWRDDASAKLQSARQELGAHGERVDRYVREQPWMAAGIAAAVGAVLGILLGGGKRR